VNAVLERRLAELTGRLAPPPVVRSPVEIAAALDIELDPWQLDVLAGGWPRALLNCSRQSGKSTVTALLAAAEITTVAGSMVLIIAPSDRQSALLFRTALWMYRQLGGTVPATSRRAAHSSWPTARSCTPSPARRRRSAATPASTCC
jgi:hypothetical protein